MLLLICALTPVLPSVLLPFLRLRSRRARLIFVMAFTCLTSGLVCFLAFSGRAEEATELFRLSESLRFILRLDGAGKVYLALAAVLWPLAVLYAAEYMRHEAEERNFFSWYLLTFGAAVLLGAAGNLFTLYIAYEFLTLCTTPLVWHERNEESTRAAIKYMLYLIGGAALGFVAVMLSAGAGNGEGLFALGGLAGMDEMPDERIRLIALLGFLGFGAKAAVLPLSHWLPAASVAPTPVTALLHAVAVVNAGVFAVARVLYYTVPSRAIQGTWAQQAMLALCAATVVYGAAMAVREQHLKRRLAWSTVSNLSYMLLGLSLLTKEGMAAGLAHMVFHGLMKIILFFCAGAVLVQTGRTQARQMHGLGRKMPLVFFCFTLAGTSLLGVPPLPGFVSKYALVTAAFQEGSAWALIGGAALLLSAVLTAVYIFTVVYPAFFMKLYLPDGEETPRDPGWPMKISLGALSLLLIFSGIFAQPIMGYLANLAGGVMG